jgi:glutaminyl-tRNA synthetase
VRLYDRLFSVERPNDPASTASQDSAEADFRDHLNPDSLKQIRAKVEPAILNMAPGTRCQFERKGYFFSDPKDSSEGAPVFNQIVPLRDSWRKRAK